MMTTHRLGRVQSPRIIRIGHGAALEVAEVLGQLGLSRPLIVTDAGLVALGHVQKVTDMLDRAALPWGLFDGVTPDPTDACVDAGLAAFRAGSYDCIIGFGGGSPRPMSRARRTPIRTASRCKPCRSSQLMSAAPMPTQKLQRPARP